MSPTPTILVSCTEWERLSVRITQLEKRIETLQDIRANEEFIDYITASVQAVEPSCAKGLTQTFLRGITADVESHAADLADTLPWMCPNDWNIWSSSQTGRSD